MIYFCAALLCNYIFFYWAFCLYFEIPIQAGGSFVILVIFFNTIRTYATELYNWSLQASTLIEYLSSNF
jgi:hypothetical protein